jgi:hypothetical protein
MSTATSGIRPRRRMPIHPLIAVVALAAQVAFAQSVPVVPNVPQEEAYELRGLPPQEAAQEASAEEGPNRYLESERLASRGIKTYGWIDVGIGANNWGSAFNGPITFNDANWMGQLNQLYLVNEKLLDTEGGGWDWGGRIDLLYGTDYLFTTARGLDAYDYDVVDGLGRPKWNSNKWYGLAMPQLYGELGAGNHAVKFGHFYTIIGYDVVPAIGNFFYTHAYCFQYGEPFTHTGILDTWKATDQLTVYAGITNGWDNFSEKVPYGEIINNTYPGWNSNAAFLGGASLKSADESQSLTITTSSGNEYTPVVAGVSALAGNRSIISTVYINKLSDKLTYVLQNDNGWQSNANCAYRTQNQTKDTAQWYGINQYLFWNFTDQLIGGMRCEWFRDNNGTRVFNPLRNWLTGNFPQYGGYAGNFWHVSWGLNWKPNGNWVIRPELRYDWFDGVAANTDGSLPFGNGDRTDQLYGGCDAIWQF